VSVGVDMGDFFSYRGLWISGLMNLEKPSSGPWDNNMPRNLDVFSKWKKFIDWMKRNRLNVNITCFDGSSWDLHKYLHFDENPESRVFDEETVDSNIELMKQALAYAKENGIQSFIHHYNFMAPINFVKSHPSVRNKLLETLGASKLPEGMIIGNICWNEPEYKDFLINIWKELFKRFPELDGLLVTYGEPIYCKCKECQKREETGLDFINTYIKTLRGMGKTPLIRTHYEARIPGQWYNIWPREDAIYVIKYSLFDCVTEEPDPVIAKWVESGHKVWITKDLYGENSGGLVWGNPKFIRNILYNSYKLGVTGVIGFHNKAHEFRSFYCKTLELNMEAFIKYSHNPKEYREEDWVRYLSKIFGEKVGRTVLRSLESSSKGIFAVSKVIGEYFEGYTFRWTPNIHFTSEGIWPNANLPSGWGRNLTFGLEDEILVPPEHWRRDIVTLKEIIDHLSKNQWSEDLLEKIKGRRKSPTEFLEETAMKVEEAGMALMEAYLKGEIKEEASMEYSALYSSIQVIKHLNLYWKHLLAARIYYSAVKSVINKNLKRRLASMCISEFKQAVDHLDAMKTYPFYSAKPFFEGIIYALKKRVKELQIIQEMFHDLIN